MLEQDRVGLALGHLDGNDLFVELAGLGRRRRLVVAVGGELVLGLAGDMELAGHELRRVAHVVVLVDVPQAVRDHRVG